MHRGGPQEENHNKEVHKETSFSYHRNEAGDRKIFIKRGKAILDDPLASRVHPQGRVKGGIT